MALTATSLLATMPKEALVLNATSATGATVGGFARVDDEFMVITAITGTKIDVRSRGDQGTTATAHNILAPVVFGLTSDQAILGVLETLAVNKQLMDYVGIGANGAIPPPLRNTTYIIMKGSALASSALADPLASQDGLEVTFLGGTDFAHVVTTVSAHDGTTGLHTTLTSPAFIGGGLTLVASKTKWLVKSNNLWVIS